MRRPADVITIISMGVFVLCWIFALWNILLACRIKRPPGQTLPSLPEILGNPDDPARPYAKMLLAAFLVAAISWSFGFFGL